MAAEWSASGARTGAPASFRRRPGPPRLDEVLYWSHSHGRVLSGWMDYQQHNFGHSVPHCDKAPHGEGPGGRDRA